MKVLQTLGKQAGQHGIFQYKRTADGITIDLSIGTAPGVQQQQISFTHDEWTQILTSFSSSKILNLTGGKNAVGACLHDLIKQGLPKPSDFQKWNDSYLAYVCAILQHEGSIVFYSGAAGQGVGVAMQFTPG